MADSPRPYKRQKMEPSSSMDTMKVLPPTVLLLSLQSLLAHPPAHRQHTRSLFLSLFALRKCLSLSGLDYLTECRAWTEMAEIGFRIGLEEPGIEGEVQKAITKALLIATKHPSLRPYKPRLTLLSANLASYQNNTKFAQNNLKKLISNYSVPSDPPQATYFAHLAYIASLSSRQDARDFLPATFKVFTALHDLQEVGMRNKHPDIASLAMVLELRELMQAGMWAKISEVLKQLEQQLGITIAVNSPSNSEKLVDGGHSNIITGTTTFQTVLIVYTLILGTLFYTYAGEYANSESRMKSLHEMLDGGALDAFGRIGIVTVEFPDSPASSLEVQVIHPRVLLSLGFLVSSLAKRDPVGRKPKRRLFAKEGVATVEKGLRQEVSFPLWASVSDVQSFQQRMHKIKADMTCELIGVAITRSEFDDAEREIHKVIAHTRTHNLFSCYSARITLHQAHLAHALGQTERALKCYQVASFLSRKRSMQSPSKKARQTSAPQEDDEGWEDHWLNVSARAGELWLRVGLASVMDDEAARAKEMAVLRKESTVVIKECQGLGGTLEAVGAVLTACLSKEFLVTKTHLRTALNLSTAAHDNHLRALVLTLIAAQFVHTSAEHAEAMLTTAEQIAAGLGARPKAAATVSQSNSKKKVGGGGNDGVGNAHLRLWIGERSLELKRRAGDEKSASRQVKVNEKIGQAVQNLRKRKLSQIS